MLILHISKILIYVKNIHRNKVHKMHINALQIEQEDWQRLRDLVFGTTVKTPL